jgi:hypothetical protein
MCSMFLAECSTPTRTTTATTTQATQTVTTTKARATFPLPECDAHVEKRGDLNARIEREREVGNYIVILV